MRGSLKLFTEVLEPVPVMTLNRQGRSAELHSQRNECLLYRYFFYLNFTDKRYTSILNDLSKEFFIAPFTIQERIDENYEALLQLKSLNLNKSDFEKKWPHLVWNSTKG
jgi:hypothetical protein